MVGMARCAVRTNVPSNHRYRFADAAARRPYQEMSAGDAPALQFTLVDRDDLQIVVAFLLQDEGFPDFANSAFRTIF